MLTSHARLKREDHVLPHSFHPHHTALPNGPPRKKLLGQHQSSESRRFGEEVKYCERGEKGVSEGSGLGRRTIIGDGEDGKVLELLKKGEDLVELVAEGPESKLPDIA